MVFQGGLELVKTAVDENFRLFFDEKRRQANHVHPHCVPLVDQVESLTMRGGKRTRAFLCWLGVQTATDNKQKAVSTSLVQAMLALELFQSFALIHDDIIDEDTFRRGGKTVHEYFTSDARCPKSKVKNAKHFGMSMAILVGDLALVWADELMGEALQLSLRAQRSNLSMRGIAASSRQNVGTPRNDMGTWKLYQRMKQEVIFGQSLDVIEEYMKIGIPKELIDAYKTAWYTVIRPIQIGACLGGANTDTLEAYVPYGLAVGQSYQLRDDFLDGGVREDVFHERARKLQERAAQAIKKLTVSQAVSALFHDFARFALSRQA